MKIHLRSTEPSGRRRHIEPKPVRICNPNGLALIDVWLREKFSRLARIVTLLGGWFGSQRPPECTDKGIPSAPSRFGPIFGRPTQKPAQAPPNGARPGTPEPPRGTEPQRTRQGLTHADEPKQEPTEDRNAHPRTRSGDQTPKLVFHIPRGFVELGNGVPRIGRALDAFTDALGLAPRRTLRKIVSERFSAATRGSDERIRRCLPT
jgi:hypothetical protein